MAFEWEVVWGGIYVLLEPVFSNLLSVLAGNRWAGSL